MKNLIDLHLHLDGSLSFPCARELAQQQNLPLRSEDELQELLVAPENCRDLNQYLSVFEYPLTLLQTEEAITLSVLRLLTELKQQGLVYAEIRFAPSLSLRQGLSQEAVTAAAVRGLDTFLRAQSAAAAAAEEGQAKGGASDASDASDASPALHAGLILCAMRGEGAENEKQNLETIETAAAFLGRGVVAADLAGAEALFPTRSFRPIFRRAADLGVPYTIHAGEAAGPDSIREALALGASRIGHGVRSVEDPAFLQELAKLHMPLELCPTSNLDTRIFPRMEDYPLRRLLECGIHATINTDNMTVSNTNLRNEFHLLQDALGLTEAERSTLQRNSMEAIFAGEAEKQRLWQL